MHKLSTALTRFSLWTLKKYVQYLLPTKHFIIYPPVLAFLTLLTQLILSVLKADRMAYSYF